MANAETSPRHSPYKDLDNDIYSLK